MQDAPRTNATTEGTEPGGAVAQAVHGAVDAAEQVVEQVGERFAVLGRVGWLAKGVIYVLLGVLFVQVAITDHGVTENQANQAGAIETVAENWFGTVLLAALTGGLFIYALWRLLTAVLPGDWSGRALLDRLGYVVSAAVYGSLCVTSIGLIAEGPDRVDADHNEDRLIEDLVGDLLSVSIGRALVVIAGLVVIGIGVVFLAKGIQKSFRRELDHIEGLEGTALDRLGRVGWIARGVSMGLVGAFLVRAAWRHDPNEAAGLDDSIRQIAVSWWGTTLAVIVGVGFIAYGVFAALSARHRLLKGPENHDG